MAFLPTPDPDVIHVTQLDGDTVGLDGRVRGPNFLRITKSDAREIIMFSPQWIKGAEMQELANHLRSLAQERAAGLL